MWLLSKMLRRLVRQGELTIIDHKGRYHHFGSRVPGREPVVLRLTDAGVARDILRDPGLGAGEAYMHGRLILEQGDILALVDLLKGNGPWDGSGPRLKTARTTRAIKSISGRLDQLNWENRSKRNVAHHYDLSGRLYDLFLDADRQYSCAYFTDPGNSLEQAQSDKKAHIAAKLNLKPGLRVLDIGCGWGGMALYLHRVADVDVLGITLSEEQLGVARQRAEEAGVADRVKFELIDYRKLTGTFDRIVSVGMFEHVGPPHYGTFFAQCRALLAADGVMLLHTIGRMGQPHVTDAWTSKYIFPGGHHPSLSEIVTASEKVKLITADIELLRFHYGLTIQHWYDRAVAAKDEIVALYDEPFYRMWTFYLAGALCAFRHGGLGNYQIQYIRKKDALPITRDYIGEAEERLRALS